MSRHELDALPEWTSGTVAVLSTAGDGPPHAIPVSTGVRAGHHRIVLALALRRESLTRLRQDPRCALTLMAEGVACTAHARAEILQEPMAISDRVAAVALHVDSIQDHDQPRFEMLSGVGWRWSDPEAEARDAEIRAALASL